MHWINLIGVLHLDQASRHPLQVFCRHYIDLSILELLMDLWCKTLESSLITQYHVPTRWQAYPEESMWIQLTLRSTSSKATETHRSKHNILNKMHSILATLGISYFASGTTLGLERTAHAPMQLTNMLKQVPDFVCSSTQRQSLAMQSWISSARTWKYDYQSASRISLQAHKWEEVS